MNKLMELERKKEALKEREAKLKAAIKNEQARMKAASRKEETRKKVLTGAMVLEMVESGRWPEDKFKAAMDKFLVLPDRDITDKLRKKINTERSFFDLPPL